MSSNIQFIRNATVVLNYAGKRLLMDPFFAEKGRYPGFPGTANSHLSNPLVEMPVKPEILIDVDAVLVSHLHPDHWDEVAVQTLPKGIKILAQNEDDAKVIQSQGFTNVEALGEDASFEGLDF
ncbi:MBL fold metallo-hydrolase [Pontibacter toksunensis]|uniref:MBL fold metallo-hydrolase n=1 Tax=Pontibacter toksunensis TaxID=1332631 RepID=A0ABW6C2Q9_9BACT